MLLPSKTLPALRCPLSVHETVYQAQPVVVLSDPLGYAEDPICFPVQFAQLLAFFDGVSSSAEVITRFGPYGLDEESLNQVFELLDRGLFLESADSDRRIAAKRKRFAEVAIREAAHAGAVYPDEGPALEQYLSELYDGATVGHLPNPPAEVRAVSLPHIDYQRGAPTYGYGMQLLERSPNPAIVFLLGTAHQPASSLFHLTNKSFAVPNGTAAVASESVLRIAQQYGSERSFDDEFLHYREHSLELQIPLINRAWQGSVAIVPILVSSFHQYVSSQRAPESAPEVDEFVGVLADEIQRLEANGQRVSIYCGVDLAHMGRAFGDSVELTEQLRENIAVRDSELIAATLAGDPQALFQHIAEDNDRRRICGFPSLWLMLSVFDRLGRRAKGTLGEYRQSYDHSSDCLVSFFGAYWQ